MHPLCTAYVACSSSVRFYFFERPGLFPGCSALDQACFLAVFFGFLAFLFCLPCLEICSVRHDFEFSRITTKKSESGTTEFIPRNTKT